MAHSCGRPESRWCKDTRPGKRSHSWMEYPPFLIGNTNLHSGSIFQPAMLNYRSVFFVPSLKRICLLLMATPRNPKNHLLRLVVYTIPWKIPLFTTGFSAPSQVGFSRRISGVAINSSTWKLMLGRRLHKTSKLVLGGASQLRDILTVHGY